MHLHQDDKTKRRPLWPAFFLFFVSGAIALTYEVIWIRQLSLVFSSASVSVCTVLAAFMGGLAFGASRGGGTAYRLTAPLERYGHIELGIAAYALLSPWTFEGAFSAFDFAASLGAGPLIVARILIASILLGIPAFLMGMTLPVLVEYVQRGMETRRKLASTLYTTNTFGAAFGVSVAGIYLLPTFGSRAALLIAVGVNIAVGIAAVALGQSNDPRVVAPKDPDAGHRPRWFDSLTAVCLLTGAAGLLLEVAWTRALILLIGPSLYAFSLMLTTYLLGLAAGAITVSLLKEKNVQYWVRLIFGAAVSGSILSVASLWMFSSMPGWFIELYRSMNLQAAPGSILFIQCLFCLVIMFPASFCQGVILPAAIRAGRTRLNIALDTGSLYAFNTVGAILGSLVGGLLLLPLIGVRGVILLASALLLLGGFLGSYRHVPSRVVSGLICGALFFALYGLTPTWKASIMTHGTYRYAGHYTHLSKSEVNEALRRESKLLFYSDGRNATVSVAESQRGEIVLALNGKVEGSDKSDLADQRLIAHLPLSLHPNPESVAVIGFGTGCTVGSASLHPGTTIDAIELEPRILEAESYFNHVNHTPSERENVNILVRDGRLHLRANPGEYDVIISEPSNPWLAGTTDLFTREFFGLGKSALRENGLFCQWIQIHSMRPTSFATAIGTFVRVFPHTYLASSPSGMELILIGSSQPFLLQLKRIRAALAVPEVQKDLSHPNVNIRNEWQFLARLRMPPADVLAAFGQGPQHTDDLPVLAYTGPLDFYADTTSRNRFTLDQLSPGIACQIIFETDEDNSESLAALRDAYKRLRKLGREWKETERLRNRRENEGD